MENRRRTRSSILFGSGRRSWNRGCWRPPLRTTPRSRPTWPAWADAQPEPAQQQPVAVPANVEQPNQPVANPGPALPDGDQPPANPATYQHDEIKTFLNCRYISAPEAVWRLFKFRMHDHSHTIVRLALHLPQQQSVVFREG